MAVIWDDKGCEQDALHYLAAAVCGVKDVASALIAEEREVKLNEQLN